jgi:hypothetical protein
MARTTQIGMYRYRAIYQKNEGKYFIYQNGEKIEARKGDEGALYEDYYVDYGKIKYGYVESKARNVRDNLTGQLVIESGSTRIDTPDDYPFAQGDRILIDNEPNVIEQVDVLYNAARNTRGNIRKDKPVYRLSIG